MTSTFRTMHTTATIETTDNVWHSLEVDHGGMETDYIDIVNRGSDWLVYGGDKDMSAETLPSLLIHIAAEYDPFGYAASAIKGLARITN